MITYQNIINGYLILNQLIDIDAGNDCVDKE
jgi:hypothetical protein